MKKVLIVGASITNKATLEEMLSVENIEIHIADGNKDSIARELTSNFYSADILDKNAILNLARSIGIQAIYAMNDHALRAVVYTANCLGLKSISMDSAEASLNKALMRNAWTKAKLRQPNYRIIQKKEDIYSSASEIGYPVVIKPVDCGGGGRGVFIIESEKEIDEIYEKVKIHLRYSNKMIVEAFINGIEASAEIALTNRECKLIAYSDKIKAPLQSRVATDINYPGNFSNEVVEGIRKLGHQAMLALGIEEGIGHFEFIINEKNEIYLLEMGSRAGGGHTFHPIASHVCGFSYPKWLLNYLLEKAETPIIETYKGASYKFLYSTKNATLVDLKGVELAEKIKEVDRVELWKKKGHKINSLDNSMERLACLITLASDRKTAVEKARLAFNKLELVLS